MIYYLTAFFSHVEMMIFVWSVKDDCSDRHCLQRELFLEGWVGGGRWNSAILYLTKNTVCIQLKHYTGFKSRGM